jgi:hypothetical protein
MPRSKTPKRTREEEKQLRLPLPTLGAVACALALMVAIPVLLDTTSKATLNWSSVMPVWAQPYLLSGPSSSAQLGAYGIGLIACLILLRALPVPSPLITKLRSRVSTFLVTAAQCLSPTALSVQAQANTSNFSIPERDMGTKAQRLRTILLSRIPTDAETHTNVFQLLGFGRYPFVAQSFAMHMYFIDAYAGLHKPSIEQITRRLTEARLVQVLQVEDLLNKININPRSPHHYNALYHRRCYIALSTVDQRQFFMSTSGRTWQARTTRGWELWHDSAMRYLRNVLATVRLMDRRLFFSPAQRAAVRLIATRKTNQELDFGRTQLPQPVFDVAYNGGLANYDPCNLSHVDFCDSTAVTTFLRQLAVATMRQPIPPVPEPSPLPEHKIPPPAYIQGGWDSRTPGFPGAGAGQLSRGQMILALRSLPIGRASGNPQTTHVDLGVPILGPGPPEVPETEHHPEFEVKNTLSLSVRDDDELPALVDSEPDTPVYIGP